MLGLTTGAIRGEGVNVAAADLEPSKKIWISILISIGKIGKFKRILMLISILTILMSKEPTPRQRCECGGRT